MNDTTLCHDTTYNVMQSLCIIYTSGDGYRGFILKHLNKELDSEKFKDCEKQTISTHR